MSCYSTIACLPAIPSCINEIVFSDIAGPARVIITNNHTGAIYEVAAPSGTDLAVDLSEVGLIDGHTLIFQLRNADPADPTPVSWWGEYDQLMLDVYYIKGGGGTTVTIGNPNA